MADEPMFDRRPRCPHCTAVADDFLSVEGDETPDEGSVSICLYCLGISVYTGEGLFTRKPTDEELRDIMADPQVVVAVQVLASWPDRPGIDM